MFKETMKALDDSKNSQKNVESNVFWHVKVCILWKSIHWDKTQILKKYPSDKING